MEPIDRVEEIGRDGNISIPIGHYALSNGSNIPNTQGPNFVIYGLGSCIALILFDDKNIVSALSHILLPKVLSKEKISLPHKYAELSVKLLLESLIKHGAVRENVKAIIVGGSKIFDLENNIMGIDNITSVKNELETLKIKIVFEDVGGSKGRNVIFDSQRLTLYTRFTDDKEFKRVY